MDGIMICCKNVSHFKTRPEDELFFDVNKYKKQYFSDEKIKGIFQVLTTSQIKNT